jgi:Fe(II)/alpha-ketoglutarate-dependent arginine beta-hydroxylase
MHRFQLSAPEVNEVRSLVREFASRHESMEREEALNEALVAAHELPRRLRAFITEFRLNEPKSAHCVVSGFPVDQDRIGRTPKHWKVKSFPCSAHQEEAFLVMLGSLLGEPIGWATQQDGRIVHDIFPIAGHETEQLGSGSEQLLWWHTEDAFHPYRGDFLGMMCLRNPDRVATTVAAVDVQGLNPRHVELLFEPHFVIRPDESHLKKNSGDRAKDAAPELDSSYALIEQMNERPEKIAVLYGSPEAPYARLDPYFMDPVEDEPEAQEALDALIQRIEMRLTEVVLDAGDICLIDNHKAVHGRRPFKARQDGNDRWLKRINVARDLRKSRRSRAGAASRVIL